jgi:hypothetical protein
MSRLKRIWIVLVTVIKWAFEPPLPFDPNPPKPSRLPYDFEHESFLRDLMQGEAFPRVLIGMANAEVESLTEQLRAAVRAGNLNGATHFEAGITIFEEFPIAFARYAKLHKGTEKPQQ